MVRPSQPRSLHLMLSALLGLHAAEVDYVAKLQQTLGSASIAYRESNFDGTLAKLDQLQQTLGDWRTAILAKKEAGAAPVEPEKEPEPPAESIEFSMNQTFVPEKCKRKSEEGATMRVHYVGKLLTGSKKMFASSFHTGSTPYKFKLGSSEVVDAWNEGLLGMCEGVPWTHTSSSGGTAIHRVELTPAVCVAWPRGRRATQADGAVAHGARQGRLQGSAALLGLAGSRRRPATRHTHLPPRTTRQTPPALQSIP